MNSDEEMQYVCEKPGEQVSRNLAQSCVTIPTYYFKGVHMIVLYYSIKHYSNAKGTSCSPNFRILHPTSLLNDLSTFLTPFTQHCPVSSIERSLEGHLQMFKVGSLM